MGSVDREDLGPYLSTFVQVGIFGNEREDQPPWLEKKLVKTELCPDHTHLRIFFDPQTFVAIPLTSAVTQSQDEWCAYDHTSGLSYVIKR
ncbi:hypothetical protein [Halobacillus amylolyticus]|uniref:Uncharacterized protein n=1 Tax=Halobacillus amylolyticus TaxID=2932259 RepID=A0ABY4H8H3_9BACI|nr:hypothetical protein [Halobacillus amylolyticus]UOR10846.1 hypothetical protein MUO15_14625 [Halobacillus amylolyticus]